ncbi:glucose 1-dehydrogenase [Paraburkholderia sp. CNPSo 3157]|uniref:Glucose 1-dehydrogenase n=1 Tax=Paraburkholderia franconis TaxID=2654983 RepID=A0A7X1TK69_9BURK|nr:SDR family NAD(P)-dependent oxidoreductase [Paraburkholderia franconis]MPW22094.1 glucose 1-dehydrogenase [Paraburkholderia franconis]
MKKRLQGKRIVITGAVDNIGKAAVAAFVEEGAKVVIGDIDGARGEKVAAEFGPNVRFIRVDVTDDASVRRLIDDGADWLGGLDVLAQNAGAMTSGAITELDPSTFDKLFAVNVRGLFLGAKYAVPHLRRAGGGSIINTASLAGKRGQPGLTVYSASKGAVIAFGTTLALELAKDRIRVNTICPGWIDTTFNDPIVGYMGGRGVQDEKVAAAVPLGRQGMSSEVAPLFVFLASDESSYVNAQALLVDGGTFNA